MIKNASDHEDLSYGRFRLYGDTQPCLLNFHVHLSYSWIVLSVARGVCFPWFGVHCLLVLATRYPVSGGEWGTMSKNEGNILDGDRQDIRGSRAAFGLSAAVTKLRADGGQRERSAGRMHDRVAVA